MSMFVSDKVYCDSYDCPDNYKLVDDADDVVCKDKKCTKDQCCKKGEASPKRTLREVDDDTRCHKLESKFHICWRSFRVSVVCPRKCNLWVTFNQKYGCFSF